MAGILPIKKDGSQSAINEQSLRSVIKLAYFSYKDQYLKFEDLPSGNGYADIVYFPKKLSPLPILVVELKWNQDAKGEGRKHTCVISHF